MLWGDLLHLPIQAHLLYAATKAEAPFCQAIVGTSIACILAFQLLYHDVTAKTSQTPWADGAKLLARPWTLACYANHFVMIWWARFFYAQLGSLTVYMGTAVCFNVMNNRVRATYQKETVAVNEQIAQSSFGMNLGAYVRMTLLNQLPHNLLRCVYSPMYVALWGYTTSEAVGTRWLLGELWVGLVLQVVFGMYASHWYYLWHKWLHDDPVLYRGFHKWHHLYKPTTPIASTTETCMEFTAQNCTPFTIFVWNLVLTYYMDSHNIETHNTASWWLSGGNDGPRRAPHDWHLKHHLTPDSNYGLEIGPMWDKKGGSAKRTDDRDVRYVAKTTGWSPQAAAWYTLEQVSLWAAPRTEWKEDNPALKDPLAFDPNESSIANSNGYVALAPLGVWVGAVIVHSVVVLW